MSNPDISQLTDLQQAALQEYTEITDQDPITAIPVLQRAEWNVQIAVSRFFDGEPATDVLADAQAEAARSIPAPSARQTANLQYESLLAANGAPGLRRSVEDTVRRVDTSTSAVPAYRPPFLLSILLTPFNVLFRIFGAVFSPLSFLLPGFVSRIVRNLLTVNATPSRRQLPPADTAQRFIREFEEIYTPNPPLPFVETGFNLALDTCQKGGKFLLAILLSPSHDDTNTWVRETLLSSTVYQFLQSHRDELVVWGGSAHDAEGYQVSTSLNCSKFPFAALICQTADPSAAGTSRPGTMSVVARIAGPTSASDLTAKLATAMTAQQAQLSAARAQRAEQQAQRNLRQEQDSAYERSLAQDRERTRKRREEEAAQALAEKQALEVAAQAETLAKNKAGWRAWKRQHIPAEPPQGKSDAVRLSIRMITGERVVRRFDHDATFEELYAFVDCFEDDTGPSIVEISPEPPADYDHEYTFRLVSPMPRTVFDHQTSGTLGRHIGRSGNIIVEPIEDYDEQDEEDG